MSQSESELKHKYETIDRLLQDEHILVHLDSRFPGTRLPPLLVEEQLVTLKLSRYFRGAMELRETEISAELLFNNRYFPCVLPLAGVWAVTSAEGKTTVWSASAPGEALEGQKVKQSPAHAPAESQDRSAPAKKERPQLKRVK